MFQFSKVGSFLRVCTICTLLWTFAGTESAAADLSRRKIQKIGNLSPSDDSGKYIWIVAQNAQLRLRDDCEESSAFSTTPEAWSISGGTVQPNYTYEEKRGIKIRYGQVAQKYAVDLYHHGKYWRVTRELIKPLDDADVAETGRIRGHFLYLGHRKLGKLSKPCQRGKWYQSVDLEVQLARGFRDNLHVEIFGKSTANLANWSGDKFLLKAFDRSTCEIGSLRLHEFRIVAARSAKVIAGSVDSDFLDINAMGTGASISISGGKVGRLHQSGGQNANVLVNAQVGLTEEGQNSIDSRTAQTGSGSKVEVPNYGTVELK